jgi:hypothetical protein
VINAIEQNLELMMEVYTLLCVEKIVPWSYVDNLSLKFSNLYLSKYEKFV